MRDGVPDIQRRASGQTSSKSPSSVNCRRQKRHSNDVDRDVQRHVQETSATSGDDMSDIRIERSKNFPLDLLSQKYHSYAFSDKLVQRREAVYVCDEVAMDPTNCTSSYRLPPTTVLSPLHPVRARFFGDDIEKERFDNISIESALDGGFLRYDDDVVDDDCSIHSDFESDARLPVCFDSANRGYPVCLGELTAAQTPLLNRTSKKRKPMYFDDADVSELDADQGEGRTEGRHSKLTIASGNRRHLTIRRRLNSFNNRLMLLTGVGSRLRCDCSTWFKKVVGFLASTVGLTFLLICYTVFGGWLFRCLEIQTVLHEKENMRKVRDRYVEQLWNVTERLNVLFQENWTSLASDILDSYSVEVYKATKRRGWDGTTNDMSIDDNSDTELDSSNDEGQWSYAGAMLYSITVITTIGA